MTFPLLDPCCLCCFLGDKLNLTQDAENVDLHEYQNGVEFDLLEAQQKISTVVYTLADGTDEPYTDITINIHIGRKPLNYIYSVVAPCIIFSILILVVFWLPPESREKITLGILVLLGLTIMLWAIADKLPQNGISIPLLGIYIIVVMAMAAVSVIMSAVVLNCCYLGSSCGKVPSWIRWLVLERLGRLLCMKSGESNLNRNQPKKQPLVRRLAQKRNAEEKLLEESEVAAVDGISAKLDCSLQVRKWEDAIRNYEPARCTKRLQDLYASISLKRLRYLAECANNVPAKKYPLAY